MAWHAGLRAWQSAIQACAQRALTAGADRLYINPRPAPSGFLALEKAVTGTRISSEGWTTARRRLLFRSWHRGIREMDLVMGRFADAHIATFSDAELDEYETWLEVPDQQIFAWVTGAQQPPPQFDTALFRRLRDFHLRRAGRLVSVAAKSPAERLHPGKPLTLAQVADGAEGLVLADLARAIAARTTRRRCRCA